jgi:hypothetical protein
MSWSIAGRVGDPEEAQDQGGCLEGHHGLYEHGMLYERQLQIRRNTIRADKRLLGKVQITAGDRPQEHDRKAE